MIFTYFNISSQTTIITFYWQPVCSWPTFYFFISLLPIFAVSKTKCYSRWLPPLAQHRHRCALHCPHCCLRCCPRCCCWCREWSWGHFRLHRRRRPRRRRPVVSNTPVSWAVVQWVTESPPPLPNNTHSISRWYCTYPSSHLSIRSRTDDRIKFIQFMLAASCTYYFIHFFVESVYTFKYSRHQYRY